MGRGTLPGAHRVAMAAAVALLGVGAATIGVSAATFNFTPANEPAAPLHVAVGDLITFSIPPSPPPRPGWVGPGPERAALPTSSDSSILPRISGVYDSAGNAIGTFQAARAGTAAIGGIKPSSCSSSTLTSTTSAAASATTSSTNSVATTSSTPAVVGLCDPVDSTTIGFTVIVDAAVQGVSTSVPAAGAASVPWAGVGMMLGGMAVVASILAWFDTRRRR